MSPRWLLLTGVALWASCAYAGGAPAPAWQAGAAKVVITPRLPTWMSGYAGRTGPAEGKVHDLWAKALALQDGAGNRCVLVTLDLVGIDRDTARAICADLEKHHGLSHDAVMLATSHTHCGPVVGTNLRTMYFLDEEQNRRIDDYTKELHGLVVGVVAAALKDLAPAQLSWGNGLTTFATNRRNNKEAEVPQVRELGKLNGPVHHDVPVLAVRGPDGKLRATVFGYACHATVLGFNQWCGDYPGFAQLELEKAHPGSVALFWAGCGADQNPLPRRTVALAESYGRRLAAAVNDVLGAPMRPVGAGLRTSYAEIPLALADLPTRETLAEDLRSPNKYVAARAKVLMDRVQRGESLSGTYPYPVQAWKLGDDLTWVSLGGEVVVDYVLRLNKELGPVWVTGYANDVMAYIPSLRVLKEGGYEGANSMVYYGLPTVWGPRVEEQVVGAAHERVKAVRGR